MKNMYTYTIILYGIILIADELVATKVIRRTIKGRNDGGSRIRRKLQPDINNNNNNNNSNDNNINYNEGPHMMGKAAFDFPVLSRIPNTKFNCKSFDNGYYADVDTSCQVFHICDNGRKTSFLCPNGTIFRQSHVTCDWWFRVDCANSNRYYNQANNNNISKDFNSETALPQYNNNENEYIDKENQILAESASFARSNDYHLNQIQSSSQSSILRNGNTKTETTSSKNSISEILLENSSNGPVVYYPYETQTTLPHHLLTGMTKEAYDSLFGGEKEDKVKENLDSNNNEGINDIDYTTTVVDYTTTTESGDEFSFKSSSNLRELAQIFSRALSSYLENPEEFRKVLSEVRPTEPTAATLNSSAIISEEKEVLSFSENTKPDVKPQVFAEEINKFMSKEQLDWASTEEEKEDNSIIRRTTGNPVKINDDDDGLITSDTQSFLSRDNRIKTIIENKVKSTTPKNDLVLLLVNKKSIRNDGKKELLNALVKKGGGGVKEESKDKSRPSRKTEENTKNQLSKQSDNRAIHLLSSLYSLINSK